MGEAVEENIVAVVIMIVILLSNSWGEGKNSLGWIRASGVGKKIVLSGYHAGVFCMVILTFLIHKYNTICWIV